MRNIIALLCTLSLATLTGCTSLQLRESTVQVGATVTDLNYDMVLSNIAMMRAVPNALPWAMKLSQGAVTLTDMGQIAPGFSTTYPQVTPSTTLTGSRSLADGWTVTPLADPDQIKPLAAQYQEFVHKDWIHDGGGSIPSGAFVGHYKDHTVWVSADDIQKLNPLVLDSMHALLTQKGASSSLLIPGTPANIR